MPDTKLDQMDPEEHERYIGKWREFFGRLPRAAYTSALTRVTRQYGPEFVSQIMQPELPTQEAEPIPPAQAVATQMEPEIPWYQKPIKWAAEQPALKPAFQALEEYQKKWVTPAAMTIAQPWAPKLRQQLGGRSPFAIPEEQRAEVWGESGLPWLAKIAAELVVDPTSYIGWGIPGALEKTAARAGFGAVAKMIHPATVAEEAFVKAAALPIKIAGKAFRKLPVKIPIPETSWADVLLRGGKVPWVRIGAESPRSIAKNLPTHTANALLNLHEAGAIPSINKPYSQILEDIKLGVPDRALLDTITNPKQQQVIQNLVKYKDKLGLDELIRNADKNPGMTTSMLGQRLIKASAQELGIAAPKLLTGTLASYEKYANKLYGLWKRAVLTTPYYVTQNLVENTIRPIFVGVNPFSNISDYAKLPSLGQMPMEIQHLVVAISEDLGKPIPVGVSKFALTPELGGMTEAVIGGLTRGKLYSPTHAAAFLDRAAMVRTFFQGRENIVKNLLETVSPQTKVFQMEMRRIYGDAIKTGLIEPKMAEHLQQISLTGSLDDFIHEINTIQKTKHLAIARPMTDIEQALPEIIRQRIAKDIPSAWAKNDVKAIDKIFDDVRNLMPQYIGEYQKAQLIQNLREFRNLLRAQIPTKYQPHLTRLLKKFSYEKVGEAEARVAAAKTLTEYERALFDLHVDARRELELLAEENIVAEMVANNVDPKVLGAWMDTSDAINRAAFNSGDIIRSKTFEVANTIRHSTDPTKIKQAWDSYIMEIQSMAPDLAETMRIATPDNDLLWSAYRKVQEQRWFNVGQDKLRAAQEIAGIKISPMPTTKDATGKIITQEDFMQNQVKAIESWRMRAEQAFEKRFDKATSKDKLLDSLREQTVKAKESIALQERQIQNQASDMSMDLMYSTFGNYAQRTNLDEFMTGIGAPFWFFPSRSIPFYITQMLQHPRLGVEVLNLQRSMNESEQPSRLFGSINIPGTNYYYNPIQSSMLWQLANQGNFTPQEVPPLEGGMDWMRSTLGVSLGPQWRIGASLVERVLGRQAGTDVLTGEPQPIIPQQRWLDAVAGLKLPVVSPIAGLLNEPFDMYLRAVYGDKVANWQQREIEKTIVDMGYNPQDPELPADIIQKAWNRYYTRQLISIPGGAVKEMTPTEMARFEAVNQKAKELGLTKEQRVTLRASGESPFVGLRQDQIEAIYKDVPAQKLWRYIRPSGLTSQSKPYWEDYIQSKLARETLLYGKDKDNPTKGSRLYNERQYDKALQTGKISPQEWKSLYRQNYQWYINSVEQLGKDYPLAPKTDADWEAYRQMLGWKESVRHPDDIKLDEYYDAMDSSNFESEIGEFDYDTYRKTEMAFLSGLPQSTVDYIKSRKDRYKTPLRAAYTRDMEKVQPYYALQDAVLGQYPPHIATLIEQASTATDPIVQKAILIRYPQAMVALRRIRLAKDQLRLRNPEIDRILRFWS